MPAGTLEDPGCATLLELLWLVCRGRMHRENQRIGDRITLIDDQRDPGPLCRRSVVGRRTHLAGGLAEIGEQLRADD